MTVFIEKAGKTTKTPRQNIREESKAPQKSLSPQKICSFFGDKKSRPNFNYMTTSITEIGFEISG